VQTTTKGRVSRFERLYRCHLFPWLEYKSVISLPVVEREGSKEAAMTDHMSTISYYVAFTARTLSPPPPPYTSRPHRDKNCRLL
jgi:hypothetical protein